jgi:hypothetical protein
VSLIHDCHLIRQPSALQLSDELARSGASDYACLSMRFFIMAIERVTSRDRLLRGFELPSRDHGMDEEIWIMKCPERILTFSARSGELNIQVQ